MAAVPPDHEPADATAVSLISFLRRLGADGAPHAGGRTLLDHLMQTRAIIRRWEQPEWLQHAALAHSVYGTDTYHQQLLARSRRHELAAIIGAPAERVVYLFCVTPRRPLFAGTHRWARAVATPQDGLAATREELDAVLLLHMANLADQAQAPDGTPGRWLVRLRELGRLLVEGDAVHPPPFLPVLAETSEGDEQLARTAYLTGQLALAAASCPVIAEPCIWLGHLATGRDAAQGWGRQARARLRLLGTAWDKRLSYDEWSWLADRLADPGRRPSASVAELTHPRQLLESVRNRAPARPTGGRAGRERFHRYVESLSLSGAVGSYPDLPSRPWFEPDAFPLARHLESHYAEIREELLALEPGTFHRETESIPRAGDWDVLFLLERGRPNRDVLAACPVTARALESPDTIRTPAGLSYVSRMRPATHIAPHRGPTNLRVRCHLGIQVPEGDCAIRVEDETRAWQEGSCLVFDDHFEHEAWNHTAQDRIVLIVDLWHPGLAGTEVELLAGLQGQMHDYARRLRRYWSGNERAAGED